MSLFYSISTIYAFPNSIQLFFESKKERTIFIKRSDLYLIQKEPAYFAFRAHRYAFEFQASISHTMLLVLTLTIFFCTTQMLTLDTGNIVPTSFGSHEFGYARLLPKRLWLA